MSIKYLSTRDASVRFTPAQAIVSGLAPGGGLFVPERIPTFAPGALEALIGLDYPSRAARVLAPWLTGFPEEALETMCRAAYARFDSAAVAPVVALENGLHMLELWHGPTLAFKDMALQLMPHLLAASARQTGERREICILVATSGDTGKAALEGFADVPGVKICVFYPENGVSEAQLLQMVTQAGGNVRVVAVRGNFDDAQTGVKRIFADPKCSEALNARGVVLSSANSINLGRLAPQIAYYCSAYVDMVSSGAIAMGEAIDVCVPTGNFGNILAAEYARDMGLPIGRLLCASNENNVLFDFIETGVYDRNRPFHLTSSPSMDILISSNLERLLFELSGRDDAQVRAWMARLAAEGRYRLVGEPFTRLQATMSALWAGQDAVAGEIRETWAREGYLLDPHTAVAMRTARAFRAREGAGRPMLVVSTASPYKFGRTVLEALTGPVSGTDDFACCERLAEITAQQVPEAIAALKSKPVLHRDVCAADGLWQALQPLVER
ncbi:MAG: threonine synthase [Eubacteriales bacterium]|nr:threonine synthase [Christensenellaceae bacterium]MEA5064787.1 threonine synthase [Eubacteriales bacterium]